MDDDTPTPARSGPDPAVLADLHAIVPDAVAALRAMLRTRASSREQLTAARVKLDAVKTLFTVTGYVSYANRIQSDAPASLSDLSAADLRRMVDRTESELAARARRVDGRQARGEPRLIDRSGAVDLEPAELEPAAASRLGAADPPDSAPVRAAMRPNVADLLD